MLFEVNYLFFLHIFKYGMKWTTVLLRLSYYNAAYGYTRGRVIKEVLIAKRSRH